MSGKGTAAHVAVNEATLVSVVSVSGSSLRSCYVCVFVTSLSTVLYILLIARLAELTCMVLLVGPSGVALCAELVPLWVTSLVLTSVRLLVPVAVPVLAVALLLRCRMVWWCVWVDVLVDRNIPILVVGNMMALTLWFLVMMLVSLVVPCRSVITVLCIVGIVVMVEMPVLILGAWTVCAWLRLLMAMAGLLVLPLKMTLTVRVSLEIVRVLVMLTLCASVVLAMV